MAANAGLGLLLLDKMAARQKQHQLRSAAAQITSKATTLLAAATTKGDVVNGASRAPPPTYFLQRCFFCYLELADGRDIYIYRGERAFCSEECRCRHILAEVDDDDSASVGVLAADCSSQLRHQAIAGCFTL